ncbi:zinc-alpha-2-glycoprotein-like isoform X3 [Ornithorhynchus anatinus]|nr:zinc-alpha-2-glycoprotein-like isoform X3 [Ornithorhynchus anatinus]
MTGERKRFLPWSTVHLVPTVPADVSPGKCFFISNHHIGTMYLTAVRGDDGFFELTAFTMLDGQKIASYNSTDQEIVFGQNWLYQVLGRNLIQEMKSDLDISEMDFRWGMENWAQYQNHSRGSQTVQVIMGCELDRGVLVVSRYRFAYEREEMLRLDELKGAWMTTGQAKKQFGHFWEKRASWFQETECYIREECPFLMRMILRFWHLRVHTPPEVTVTRRDVKDGRVIFTCLATGFFPSSILLRWVKDDPGSTGRGWGHWLLMCGGTQHPGIAHLQPSPRETFMADAMGPGPGCDGSLCAGAESGSGHHPVEKEENRFRGTDRCFRGGCVILHQLDWEPLLGFTWIFTDFATIA